MTTYLAAFFALAITEYMFATYTKSVVDGEALKAATLSAAILVVNILVVVACVSDTTTILPAAAGAAVGCWLAVNRSKS